VQKALVVGNAAKFNKLHHGKGFLLFSALSADLLGDLRDLRLCFPQPGRNPKTQRPPRTPPSARRKLSDDRVHRVLPLQFCSSDWRAL